MSKLGRKLIAAANEATEIATGHIPAARITLNGHAYVPLSDLNKANQEIARLNMVIRDREGEIEFLREPDE